MINYNLKVNSGTGGTLILADGENKFILAQPKKHIPGVEYTLTQVKPEQAYLSGLFKTRKKNIYTGKTIDKRRIYLNLNGGGAELSLNNFS